MVDDNKQYEWLTSQTRYHNEKIIEAFSLFVKLASGIVAGLIWLITQKIDDTMKHKLMELIPFLFLLVGVSTGFMIIFNFRSWWGYRKAFSDLVGAERVPRPKWTAFSTELIMLVVMATSA